MFNKETVAIILNTLNLGISPDGINGTCSQVNVFRTAANICNNKMKHHLFTVCQYFIEGLHLFCDLQLSESPNSVLGCALETPANVNRSWKRYYDPNKM